MSSSVVRLFAGVEGGATKTICSIVSECGEIIAKDTTGPTNPWYLNKSAESESNENGCAIAAKRIFKLINKTLDKIAKADAVTSNTRVVDCVEYRLESAGLCISGAGHKTIDDTLINEVIKLGAQYKVYLGNDTIAPIFTAFENGGIVMISGTGSKCLLINPLDDAVTLNSFADLKCYSSGGWGNLLGDEGSAYWIAHRTIKFVLDYSDNFLLDFDFDHSVIEQETNELKKIIFEHFKVDNFDDLMPYFYSDFKKDFIASLTAKLAEIADNRIVIKKIFEDSGYELARHIIAIQPKIDKKLLTRPEGLPIVCTGSVFKSWHLIKPGFIRCLQTQVNRFAQHLDQINLVCINGGEATLGAALLAARFYDSTAERPVNLGKYFDLSKHTTQLDRFSVPSLSSGKSSAHHHVYHQFNRMHTNNIVGVNNY